MVDARRWVRLMMADVSDSMVVVVVVLAVCGVVVSAGRSFRRRVCLLVCLEANATKKSQSLSQKSNVQQCVFF